MIMSRHVDYQIGRIDTTVHDFMSKIDEPPSTMAYVLITCLDSNFDVSPLLERSEPLKPLRGKCQRVGQGILLTTRQLLTAARHNRIFFGFDEVWFFPTPAITPKPEDLVITGLSTIDPGEIEGYREWMLMNDCSLGLGDGAGMNFCMKVRGVARYIVKAYSEAGIQEMVTGQ